jgi:hypothetical protein
MLPSDPDMLLSVINTKLRDTYKDLDSLCDDLDVSRAEIEEPLNKAGYFYQRETNQFKRR